MIAAFVVFLLMLLIYPSRLPKTSYSTIVNDRSGNLLSAKVANDGQWRFPKPDSIPDKIETAILLFEDEYFYKHPGINPVSLGRAVWQNVRAGKTVSGASTLTMQIARMARMNKRNIWSKLDEMLMALNLELFYSKEELLTTYASMAPFGGNVVGLEAASWRYFGRGPHLLSWAESATLAVLPNNPGMIFPGSADSMLRAKRNRLVRKIHDRGHLTDIELELALDEPVVSKPLPLPDKARHLHTTHSKENPGTRLNSTIDSFWQARVSDLLEQHQRHMRANGVDNAATLVVDLEDGSILAYAGNTSHELAEGRDVDMIQARRSPGSSLKPFLYAAALDRGLILEKSLLSDVPTFFGGFAPKNFHEGYMGAVNANVALSRSLNIPLVHLLDEYGYEQFHRDLKDWGLTTLEQPAGHYGLTLVLGGCEVKMWDLAQMYFSAYRKLAGQPNRDIHFDGAENSELSLPLGQDAIWKTFKTMTTLSRPEGEKSWRSFSSSQLIAWKTGTSHGFRDAWAVGMNGGFLVLVWVGNADGEGRPDLTGIKAAAPLMHQVLRLSDSDNSWLEDLKPFMRSEKVCQISGMLANPNCPTDQKEVVTNAENSGLCPYHRSFTMDASGQYRVSSDCHSLVNSTRKTAFVLPPIQDHYYRRSVSDYEGLPSLHPDCAELENPIAIIYPIRGNKIFIPKEITGQKGRAVLQATHRQPDATLYWHIDETFAGTTIDTHDLSIWVSPGIHQLKIVDHHGNERVMRFEVVGE